MHIQAKFKSHLDFSWFVPKRRFVLPLIPLILSFCLGLSRVVLLRRNLPFYLFRLLRSFTPATSHLHQHLISSLSSSLASLSLSKWLSFQVGTCHLFFTSLSRVAESFSMEPWIMFMERNDKECYLRPMVTIARVEATGVVFLGLLFSHGKRAQFCILIL